MQLPRVILAASAAAALFGCPKPKPDLASREATPPPAPGEPGSGDPLLAGCKPKLDGNLAAALGGSQGPYALIVQFSRAPSDEDLAPLGLKLPLETSPGHTVMTPSTTREAIRKLCENANVTRLALVPESKPAELSEQFLKDCQPKLDPLLLRELIEQPGPYKIYAQFYREPRAGELPKFNYGGANGLFASGELSRAGVRQLCESDNTKHLTVYREPLPSTGG